MAKYFYFISQLPELNLCQKSFLTMEWFLAEAKKWLSRKDYQALIAVDINDYSPDLKRPKIFQQYQQFEYQLRQDLGHWRQAWRRKEDYKPSSISSEVLTDGNPFEIEIKLMEHRWNYLSRLESQFHFNFNFSFIVLYFLKLQLNQRYLSFNHQAGWEKFQKVCEVHL
jgi:hypothetical protein